MSIIPKGWGTQEKLYDVTFDTLNLTIYVCDGDDCKLSESEVNDKIDEILLSQKPYEPLEEDEVASYSFS